MTINSTQPTTTTPTESVEQEQGRAAYERARALADRLVDQVPVVPDTVAARRELGTDGYNALLHFGTGLAAGHGVLKVAALVDANPVRDDVRPGTVWIEVHATVHGVPLIARALTNTVDADVLLPHATEAPAEETAEAPGEVTQPMPTVSTDPATAVVPAITPVFPRAAMAAAATPVAQDDEARCVKCGCTEDTACKGGCYWVPNEQQVDLCSACATPQQLAAMVFAPVTETRA